MSVVAMRGFSGVWLTAALALDSLSMLSLLSLLVGCSYDSRPSLGWHESHPNGGTVAGMDVPTWSDAGSVTSTGRTEPDRADADTTAIPSGSAGGPAAQGGGGGSGSGGGAGASAATQAGAPLGTGGTAAVSDAGTTSSGPSVARRPASCPTGLYTAMFSCSVFESWPIEARQREWIRRTSPEGIFTWQ